MTVDVTAGGGDDDDDDGDGSDDDNDSASPHPPTPNPAQWPPPPGWSIKRYCENASQRHPRPAGFSGAPPHTSEPGRAPPMSSADISRATETTFSHVSHFERSNARESRSELIQTTPCPHMTIFVCAHLFRKALPGVNAECESTFVEVELIRLWQNRRPPQMHEPTCAHGSAARASRSEAFAIANEPLNRPRRRPHASWWHPPLMPVSNSSVPSGTGSMQPHSAPKWRAEQRRLSRATERRQNGDSAEGREGVTKRTHAAMCGRGAATGERRQLASG